jgi:16S rRNA (uracil1498-N3)-methyltransferase
MHHFWGIRQDNNLILSEEEARHARSVLRLNDGDVVRVLDGLGSAWDGPIHFVGKREAIVPAAKELAGYGHVSGHFHLYIAPTKNADRTEWLLEKAVELGVHAITLLECNRSERRHLKEDRLIRVMQAACKQSKKGHLPKLNGPLSFADAISSCATDRKAIAALTNSATSSFLPHLIREFPEKSWAVFIGPEGDFTSIEVEQAINHGIQLVHLGPHRLRTETAGIYAVTAFAQREFLG